MLNICMEYFFRIFVINTCHAYVSNSFLILCNVCPKYFFGIFVQNIYVEYFHVLFVTNFLKFPLHVMKFFYKYLKYTDLMKSLSFFSISNYFCIMLDI